MILDTLEKLYESLDELISVVVRRVGSVEFLLMLGTLQYSDVFFPGFAGF